MDLKVILEATPEHMKELTIKHVNQRRLRDNVCNSVGRNDSRFTVLRMMEKYSYRTEDM